MHRESSSFAAITMLMLLMMMLMMMRHVDLTYNYAGHLLFDLAQTSGKPLPAALASQRQPLHCPSSEPARSRAAWTSWLLLCTCRKVRRGSKHTRMRTYIHVSEDKQLTLVDALGFLATRNTRVSIVTAHDSVNFHSFPLPLAHYFNGIKKTHRAV